MDIQQSVEYICKNLSDVYPKRSWGETALFYNPEQRLPNGVYFCTLKDKDGPNDKASDLNRQAVFRLSIGVSKDSYQQRFGSIPTRPAKGKTVATGHDFSALGELMPHPIYAWMGWICILSPDEATLESLEPLIEEAYGLAAKKFSKRISRK